MDLIVVGQGYVGLPLAVNAAKSGLITYGFDLNDQKIIGLKSGNSDSPEVIKDEILQLQEDKKLFFVSELPPIESPCIFVIAVPTPLDINRKPDLTPLRGACESIAKVIKDGSLVINESTSFIGTLNKFIAPLIKSLSNLKNIEFAVAPERIDPGNIVWNMKTTPRILAGSTSDSTRRAIEFYENFCDSICAVSSPEVAEAAKLFENTFRQVNIALVNDLTRISQKLNFSTHEIITAAATKPYGFMPFYPSIGVGGHCIPVDPIYLEYSAELQGETLQLISLANQINFETPKKVAEKIQCLFAEGFESKKIQIAGLSYKPNIADLRESPVIPLIENLIKLGASVTWHDPIVKSWNNQTSLPLQTDIDLGLIVTPHDEIDFTVWINSNIKVLDLSANSINFGWPKFI